MKHWELWQTPRYLTLLRGWVRDGVPEREIAGRMGLRPIGLTLWRRKYPAIDEALTQTGEITDYQVEDALLKAAMGYRYTEEKTEQTDKGEKLVTTEKEVSPSVTAISLWLKWRRPEIWGGEETPEMGEKPKNNLFEALGDWREEVLEGDALPDIQQAAEADADLVEAGAVSKL